MGIFFSVYEDPRGRPAPGQSNFYPLFIRPCDVGTDSLFQKNFDQTKIDVYVCQFSQSRGRDSLDVDGLFTSVFT